MKFEEMTPELQEKAKKCQTSEELLALAKKEGYKLTDEELESVSGGSWDDGCQDVHEILA